MLFFLLFHVLYDTIGYTGPDELGDCLKNCQVVVIPAGIPRKPGKFFTWQSVAVALNTDVNPL